jgi:hypothetical protein
VAGVRPYARPAGSDPSLQKSGEPSRVAVLRCCTRCHGPVASTVPLDALSRWAFDGKGPAGGKSTLVSAGQTVCHRVRVVSHLEGSSDVMWGRLPSCWGRCYTTATWWGLCRRAARPPRARCASVSSMQCGINDRVEFIGCCTGLYRQPLRRRCALGNLPTHGWATVGGRGGWSGRAPLIAWARAWCR